MSDWIDIGPLEDVPQRGARMVKTALGCVAVFRTGADEVYALDNACPHKPQAIENRTGHGVDRNSVIGEKMDGKCT